MNRKYAWPEKPNEPVIFPFQPNDREISGRGYTAITRICNAARIMRDWNKLPYKIRTMTLIHKGVKFWWEPKDKGTDS